MKNAPLTPSELKILGFISKYWDKKGHSPSYSEIKEEFGFASFFSVQRYLKQLEAKGRIRIPWENKKRAIEVTRQQEEESPSIPLLGRVAAGRPLEAILHQEFVEIPPSMMGGRGEYFALQVSGDSMIDDGIFDQDIVVIKKQASAENGQTVIAVVNNEATIKRFYKNRGRVELHAANRSYQPIIVESGMSFKIEGILHGLIRRFKTK